MSFYCDTDNVGSRVVGDCSRFSPKSWVEKEDSKGPEEPIRAPEYGAGPEENVVFSEEDFNVAGRVRPNR